MGYFDIFDSLDKKLSHGLVRGKNLVLSQKKLFFLVPCFLANQTYLYIILDGVHEKENCVERK